MFEITYSYGGHNPSHKGHFYYEDVLQVSRCCILTPQWYINSSDIMKADNVFDYLQNLPDKEYTQNYLNHPMCNGSKCNLSANKNVKEIIVGLSYACNLRCYHCWFAGHHTDSPFQKELYFHTLKSIKNNKLDKITLTNKGEPFFYLSETMDYLKNLSINDTKEIYSVTNGNCFDENNLNELKAISDNTGIKFSWVFSVDAISSKVYEQSRNGGNFEKVIKNIETTTKNFGTDNIEISFTCKKTNIAEAKFARDFYKSNFGIKTNITYDYYDPELETSVPKNDTATN